MGSCSTVGLVASPAITDSIDEGARRSVSCSLMFEIHD
jgi:hypothetical protein